LLISRFQQPLGKLRREACGKRARHLSLDILFLIKHKERISGCGESAASRACKTRGDLGQLAPRKKLLKSLSSFPEDF
jgi:hypothetical protein